MASIQRSAGKAPHDRRAADKIRIKAGHMLTFDYLVGHDISERNIARRVVQKSILRAVGCVTLPLTVLYFGSYVTAVRLHEDITNVFLMESAMRMRSDGMFLEANTVDDLWGALTSTEPNTFLDVFFKHHDMYGSMQAKNTTAEHWGDRGLVEGFSQIQGAVRFMQSRTSTSRYGQPYKCTSAITCELCRSNEGLQTVGSFTLEPPTKHYCGSWGNGSRRLDEAAEAHPGAPPRATPRRLHFSRPEIRASFQRGSQDEEEMFRFWLYPSEGLEQISERLNYFRERDWIDEGTDHVEVRMYLMNAELGRNRLEELTIKFFVTEAGSVYYERDLQAIFLQFHQSNLSRLADLCFFVILMVTSAYRFLELWKFFLKSKLFEHIWSLHTAWEWMMILAGWWNIYGFYRMWFVWEKDVISKLGPVHRRGWNLGPGDVDKVEALFASANQAAQGYASLRVIFAQYSVVLMFRFFVSFGSQPRLAIVLNTMKNVLTDFFHFLLVFLPTFMAYVISGSLIFGRRIGEFATIQGSFGACFQIAMVSEYDWENMASEFFWPAALWAWSFLLLVVLLFLNMVLAIILDIYNETRASAFPGEAIWETMGHFLMKAYRFRSWVPDGALEHKLDGDLRGQCMVTRADLEREFPGMPESQKDTFFKACRAEMSWESSGDLGKKNLLKVSGTVMDALEGAHRVVTRVVEEEAAEPLKRWVTPQVPHSKGPASEEREKKQHRLESHSFLVKPMSTKGGKQPQFAREGATVCDSYSANGPEWLEETWRLLREQRRWIEYADWNLQQMQWQIQQAHESQEAQCTGAADASSIHIL